MKKWKFYGILTAVYTVILTVVFDFKWQQACEPVFREHLKFEGHSLTGPCAAYSDGIARLGSFIEALILSIILVALTTLLLKYTSRK